jgi:hypothetical protein
MAGVASIREIVDSVESADQCRGWYVKRSGGASQASKLVILIGKKGKFDSAFFISCYRVLLLRHVVLNGVVVVLAETNQSDRVTRVMVLYVIASIK